MKAKILLVDDEKDLLEWLSVVLEKEGYSVRCAVSGEDALKIFKAEPFEMVITDIRMSPLSGIELLRQIKNHNPEIIVLMITAYASVETAIKALRYGAYDYLIKPFKLDDIKLIIKKAFSQKRIFTDDKNVQKKLKERYRFANIIGKSVGMQKIFDLVDKVAKTNTTVLINGESGTGKELIAKAVHFNSLKANKPFVSIDCGALPEDLLESELFGHVKGSFTGAIQTKQGLFEVASGGTLFLDEIGETSQAMQAKLLRTLQEREIRPVGATKQIKVDVRIIAATNRNLEEEVKRENFRKDLFYRISVISLFLPRLSTRKEDIELLVSHFLRKYQVQGKPSKIVSKECMDLFLEYNWPGNVRELENAIESSVTLSDNDKITPDDLPERIKRRVQAGESESVDEESLKGKVEQFEKEMIAKTMKEVGGNKNIVAKILKMTRRNLDYKIKRYGL
ncbi:MAG: sigma-54-dependent Fis family transcriptional regulator [Candidatus Omnitrophica bacterium]|nr:sigma-54-dependent Fis family transcriptional regulator [Candidatus Omnitrophota bacterium]